MKKYQKDPCQGLFYIIWKLKGTYTKYVKINLVIAPALETLQKSLGNKNRQAQPEIIYGKSS